MHPVFPENAQYEASSEVVPESCQIGCVGKVFAVVPSQSRYNMSGTFDVRAHPLSTTVLEMCLSDVTWNQKVIQKWNWRYENDIKEWTMNLETYHEVGHSLKCVGLCGCFLLWHILHYRSKVEIFFMMWPNMWCKLESSAMIKLDIWQKLEASAMSIQLWQKLFALESNTWQKSLKLEPSIVINSESKQERSEKMCKNTWSLTLQWTSCLGNLICWWNAVAFRPPLILPVCIV